MDIISQAQVNKYYQIRTSTELYSSAKSDAKPIGIFARGSRVLLVSNNQERLQIETNTQIVGYINHGSLVEHLNGNDSYEQDPDIFKGGIDGQYFENTGLYTTVAGLRARSEPSKSGLVIKQLNMNHRCDVDFIPYDRNGWVCGGTVWNGEGNFTFYIPVNFVGKQTDIHKVIALYNSTKGKSEATDKLLAERILEMSHWESDSIRLEALLLFRAYIATYELESPVEDIDFEIFVLKTIGVSNPYPGNELKYYYLMNGKKLDIKSVGDIDKLKLIYTTGNDFPEELGECGWGFKSAYYLQGISIIDEGSEYGFTIWKLDFTNSEIKIVVNGFELTSKTTEIEFIKGLKSAITFNGLRNGEHNYQLGNEGDYVEIKFVDGKIVLWEVGYMC